jgi:hypothetical protein
MVHQYCKSKLSQMVLLWHISCSEFILNIKFPIGTFAVFLELFVLSSIIQAHKFDSKPCILPMISLNTSWLNHAIFCLIEVRNFIPVLLLTMICQFGLVTFGPFFSFLLYSRNVQEDSICILVSRLVL